MAEAGVTFTADNGSEFTTGEDGFITGEIKLHVSDLIGLNLEGALDLFSEKLTGGDLLMAITYEPVRVEDGELVIEVSGDPEMILDILADDGDDEPAPSV